MSRNTQEKCVVVSMCGLYDCLIIDYINKVPQDCGEGFDERGGAWFIGEFSAT